MTRWEDLTAEEQEERRQRFSFVGRFGAIRFTDEMLRDIAAFSTPPAEMIEITGTYNYAAAVADDRQVPREGG